MRAIVFILLISGISFVSCKNSSKAMGADSIEPSNSKQNNATANDQEVVYDVIISFISKGAGVDSDMVKKINAVIVVFNEENGTSIIPEKVGWGREGEVDYNINLKNLSTGKKKAFAAKIKETIGTSDMVFVRANQKSVHKR